MKRMKGQESVDLQARRHVKSLALLLVAALVTFSGIKTASATEAQLIKIEPVIKNGKMDGIKIDPDTITLPKGTVVVWLSGVQGAKVKLVFNEAAACQDVTADPKLTKFYTQWYDCYTTTYLPYAHTTSLAFSQVGVFHYIVETEDGKMVTTGNLIITAP